MTEKIQKDRLLASEIFNVPGHIAQKRIGKSPGNPRLFVNIAMGYGEIDKKVDVFYEKLLAKCTNYAIINFDRRKPSKKCPKSKAKDRAIQYKSVFLSGHWRAFTQKGANAA